MSDKSTRNSVLGGMFWKFSERVLTQGTSFVVSLESDTRKEPSIVSGGRFIAANVWLRCPFAQAEPADTQIP